MISIESTPRISTKRIGNLFGHAEWVLIATVHDRLPGTPQLSEIKENVMEKSTAQENAEVWGRIIDHFDKFTSIEKWKVDLLKFIAEYELFDEILWNENLEFYILCNDLFIWGTADAEDITEETFPELVKAVDEVNVFYDNGYVNSGDGLWLYCARMAKMRPQGAAYKYISKKNWHLFDECGPKREVGFGNPQRHPDEKE